MSNEELQSKINRIRLEQDYIRMTTPKEVSETKKKSGNSFVKSVMNKVIIPAATDAGKRAVTEMIYNTLSGAQKNVNQTTKSVNKAKQNLKNQAMQSVQDATSNYNKKKR